MTPIEKLNEDFWYKTALKVAQYIYEDNYTDARLLVVDYYLKLIYLYNPEHHDENAVQFYSFYTDFPYVRFNDTYSDYYYREAIVREKFIYYCPNDQSSKKYKRYLWIKRNYHRLPIFIKKYIFDRREKLELNFINPLTFLFDNNSGLAIELESYFNPTYNNLPNETLINILTEYKTLGTSPTLIEYADGYYDRKFY